MKIRPMRALLPLLLVLALAWSCKNTSDDGGVGIPVGGGVPTEKPVLGSSDNEVLADGEDAIQIVARVTDTSGRPLDRVLVKFDVANDVGTIADPNAFTDFDGRATVVLTSVASPTDVNSQVCASVPDEVDSSAVLGKLGAGVARRILAEPPVIEVGTAESGLPSEAAAARGDAKTDLPAVVLAPADRMGCVTVTMLGVEVLVSAAKSQIPADGVRTTEISAFARQAGSGIPISNKRVRFSTTKGRIDSDITTDSNGEALAELRSDTAPGGAIVTAFVGGLDGSTDVEFTPITFSLEIDTAALPADGVSEARVVARALSRDRNPLSGLAIEFSSRIGAISSPAVTDDGGRAAATLVGDGRAGADTIVARFGGAAVGSVVVAMTETFRARRVVLSAAPGTLTADGTSQATVAAAVFDSLGGPVPDGTAVAFAIVSGGGSLPSRATTAGGIARALLTSPTVAGSAVVSASVSGVSATTTVSFTPGVAGGVQVAATPASLVGNGIETSMIVATISDQYGNLVGPGVGVSFSADRGSITSSALTNDASQAMATYTSALGAGPVKINVSAGSARGFTTITLTSGGPSQIVLVSVDRTSIGIKGSGDPETATMVFQVRSSDGVPLGPANPVTVTFELVAKTNGGVGSGEFLQPASDVTDENGLVRTVLNSGTRAGATETVARITSVSPNIASRVVPISIDGGLPVASNLTVASAELNIPGLCFYNVRTEVIGLVYDEFQNPVPEGTIVYFTSQYAGIQASDTTDEHGAANVWLISANELPPTVLTSGTYGFPNGFVQIYAQTADGTGGVIRDSSYVLFSGCSIIENLSPTSFTIGDGGCQTFTFNVWDLNHNPLAAGTRISVSSTSGTVGGDVDVTLPDAQFGYTSFSFSLCDDSPADTDPPVQATVSIKVTSRNGNVSTLATGTIN